MAAISKKRVGEYLITAFEAIEKAGGSLAIRAILGVVEKKIKPNAYELEQFEKTGHTRWVSVFHLYSIECVKAGWLIKSGGGIWHLTDEGRKALDRYKDSPEEFTLEMSRKYKEWDKAREPKEKEIEGTGLSRSDARGVSLEIAQTSALDQIVNYIDGLQPYEFQNLAAALLRGMGFHTTFIAPRGPDRGVDIIAYADPIGATSTRIKVQVKHKEQKVDSKVVRELAGAMHDGDVGLIVASGDFTRDALAEVRGSQKRIETIDLNRFIQLWSEYYEKMKEEDRALMPLVRISFLGPIPD